MRPVWYALSGRLQVRAKQSLSPAAWACHDRVDRTDQLNQLVYYRSRAAALVPTVSAALTMVFQSGQAVAVLLTQKLLGAKQF